MRACIVLLRYHFFKKVATIELQNTVKYFVSISQRCANLVRNEILDIVCILHFSPK